MYGRKRCVHSRRLQYWPGCLREGWAYVYQVSTLWTYDDREWTMIRVFPFRHRRGRVSFPNAYVPVQVVPDYRSMKQVYRSLSGTRQLLHNVCPDSAKKALWYFPAGGISHIKGSRTMTCRRSVRSKMFQSRPHRRILVPEASRADGSCRLMTGYTIVLPVPGRSGRGQSAIHLAVIVYYLPDGRLSELKRKVRSTSTFSWVLNYKWDIMCIFCKLTGFCMKIK